MARKLKLKPEQVIEALERTNGGIYLSAKALQVDRKTIQNYADRFPAIRDKIEAKRGEMLDVAEGALYRAILEGEAWAICFFLKCQGKGRGYSEKQQIEHSGNVGIATKAEDMTDDELAIIAAKGRAKRSGRIDTEPPNGTQEP